MPENKVIVDPKTLAKAKRPGRRFMVPGAVSAIVAVAGLASIFTWAYTPLRALYKVNTTANGFYAGRPFVPRGANYVRLATSSTGTVYHSTFEPGQYNGAAAQTALNGFKSAGYNVVRVFIDHGEFSSPSHGISTSVESTTPINAAYMANVADFIKRAYDNAIYTIPVLDGIPANTYYYKIAGSPQGNIQGNNVLYLDPRYVEAKELYVKEFITALRNSQPKVMGGIMAYQTDNEVFFDASKPPFSTMSGMLTSLDGVAYDMSKTASRQQAADANLVIYSMRMKKAVTSADASGLLTLGFFTNNAVGKTGFNGMTTYCSTQCSPNVNYWVPGRPAAVSIYGHADFIDMHAYPSGNGYSLKNDLASSEYSLFKKPYILGEFGAKKAVYSSNITSAAIAMKGLQTTSCTLSAKGWLFWTWDTNTTTKLANQDLFYSLADSQGAINGQLAPVSRPDPCK
jgi:hypothetical protein